MNILGFLYGVWTYYNKPLTHCKLWGYIQDMFLVSTLSITSLDVLHALPIEFKVQTFKYRSVGDSMNWSLDLYKYIYIYIYILTIQQYFKHMKFFLWFFFFILKPKYQLDFSVDAWNLNPISIICQLLILPVELIGTCKLVIWLKNIWELEYAHAPHIIKF